eukprot:6647062-Pyramimonas_sp.AAC.1
MDPILTHLAAEVSSSSPRGVVRGCAGDTGLVQHCLSELTRAFPVFKSVEELAELRPQPSKTAVVFLRAE